METRGQGSRNLRLNYRDAHDLVANSIDPQAVIIFHAISEQV